jgi:hypothetical protein
VKINEERGGGECRKIGFKTFTLSQTAPPPTPTPTQENRPDKKKKFGEIER